MRAYIGIVLCILLILFMYLYFKNYKKERFAVDKLNYLEILQQSVKNLKDHLKLQLKLKNNKESKNVNNKVSNLTTIIIHNIANARMKFKSSDINKYIGEANSFITNFNTIQELRNKHVKLKLVKLSTLMLE